MEQLVGDEGEYVIDAPPVGGIALVFVVPEGWGGALLGLTLSCGTVHPLRAVLEGQECAPKKVYREYRLVEPSTLINLLDLDIPRPCFLHVDAVASLLLGSQIKRAALVIGVPEASGPVVVGLPHSIYRPLYLE